MSQSLRNTWRMIIATVFVSLLVMAASFATLRAVAQEAPPTEDEPVVEEPVVEEPVVEESVTEEQPDLKMSADSNISFPVDI